MNNHDNYLKQLASVIVPVLMSGCAARAVILAAGFAVSWIAVYAIAFVIAAACVLGRNGLVWKIGTALVITGGIALILFTGFSNLRALITAARAGSGLTREVIAAHPAGGVTMALLIIVLLSLITALLYLVRTGRAFSMIVPIALVLIELTVCRDISIWTVVPGMIGCVAAFAMDRDTGNDRVPLSVLITSVLLVVVAIIVSPPSGSTWGPLEKLAEDIRTLTDEYVRFSEERVAFSINEKGYDHGGVINDTVVSMLGGPAEPTTDPVMRVKTDRDILLRGTIRQVYTGYSWVDDRIKARYLYYDFTHASVRNTVFDANRIKNDSNWLTIDVDVEMMAGGTSTIFIPAHMTSFHMDLSDAVYYNSTGEMFITRDVRSGDHYSFTAQIPASDAALTEAAIQAENVTDKEYTHAQQEYTVLPEGIDSRIYSGTMRITKDCTSAIEKVFAIRDFLANNYAYSLDVGYPDDGADFVSAFLLSDKKGYCSYFASAMTVMCRIAGIPARYVEGYYVHADSSGETIVTGYNAHAWTEVYLNGIGWVAVDATAAAYSAQNGLPEQQMPTMPNPDSGLGGTDGSAGVNENADSGAGGASNDETGGDAGEGSSNEDGGAGDGSEGSSNEDDGTGNNDTSDGGAGDGSDGSEGDADGGSNDGAGNDSGSDQNGDSDSNSDSEGSDSDSDGSSDSSDGDDSNDEQTPPPDDNSEPTPSPDPDEEPTPTPDPEQLPDNENTDPPQDQNKPKTWLWILIAVIVLSALGYAAYRRIRRRLTDTDPMMMCKRSKNARKAAMIMYRAILTLLIRQGYAPMNGETPEAFAARVCQNIPNDAYERFVAAAARSSYSGGSLTRAELEDGRDAYMLFLNGMKPWERIRFDVYRVLHGIGDVESIP